MTIEPETNIDTGNAYFGWAFLISFSVLAFSTVAGIAGFAILALTI